MASLVYYIVSPASRQYPCIQTDTSMVYIYVYILIYVQCLAHLDLSKYCVSTASQLHKCQPFTGATERLARTPGGMRLQAGEPHLEHCQAAADPPWQCRAARRAAAPCAATPHAAAAGAAAGSDRSHLLSGPQSRPGSCAQHKKTTSKPLLSDFPYYNVLHSSSDLFNSDLQFLYGWLSHAHMPWKIHQCLAYPGSGP